MDIECRTSETDEYKLLTFSAVKDLRVVFGECFHDFCLQPVPERISQRITKTKAHYSIHGAVNSLHARRKTTVLYFTYKERKVSVTSELPVTLYDRQQQVAVLKPASYF